MTFTLTLAPGLLAAYWTIRTLHHDRHAIRTAPRWAKITLAACALPIPGPFDEIAAMLVLAWLARHAED